MIFPLGDLDDDPSELIMFHGLSPQPRRDGFDRLRALVTIELFGLDDHRKRKGLLLDRARAIERLYFALANPADDVNEGAARELPSVFREAVAQQSGRGSRPLRTDQGTAEWSIVKRCT